MKKGDLNKKLRYWLDKRLARGIVSVFKLLSLYVLGIILFVAILITIFNLRDNFFQALWDSLATAINAYVPSSEDGSAGYLILNSVAAIVGVLFSSILIGMISSAIEDKITNLRKGNLVVLEKDHYVILGYNHGEHGLIKQLLQNGEKGKKCIVILTDLEKPEIEDDIANSITTDKNTEIICRHGDITRINDLRICSIEKARVIIVNAIDDTRRVKALLAVSALKKEYPDCKAKIISCISNRYYLLPKTMLDENEIIMLQTNSIMASIIAQSCMEPGLSYTFNELIQYEGNDLYFEKNYSFTNKSFAQVSSSLLGAIALGIRQNDVITLNPDKDLIVEKDDELLLLEKSIKSYEIVPLLSSSFTAVNISKSEVRKRRHSTIVFGGNILLDDIIKLLRKDNDLTLVGLKNDKYISECLVKHKEIKSIEYDSIADDKNGLSNIVKNADHVIILADRDISWEDADANTSLLLLKLADIKKSLNLQFNISAELVKENSYNYVPKDLGYDYVITSTISSMILGQIADKPMLRYVFYELLTPNGNSLSYKSLREFGMSENSYYVMDLKQHIISYGYIFIGYTQNGVKTLNPTMKNKILLKEDDKLIVLGKN